MIQFMRGTKSQLTSNSSIIAAGQPVFESDTGQLKIGNGKSRYSALEYVGSIFENTGGGEVTVSGNQNRGYIDFPGGLRFSYGSTNITTRSLYNLGWDTAFQATNTNQWFTPPDVKSTLLGLQLESDFIQVWCHSMSLSGKRASIYFMSIGMIDGQPYTGPFHYEAWSI